MQASLFSRPSPPKYFSMLSTLLLFFYCEQCHIAKQQDNAGPNSSEASIKGLEQKIKKEARLDT